MNTKQRGQPHTRRKYHLLKISYRRKHKVVTNATICFMQLNPDPLSPASHTHSKSAADGLGDSLETIFVGGTWQKERSVPWHERNAVCIQPIISFILLGQAI